MSTPGPDMQPRKSVDAGRASPLVVATASLALGLPSALLIFTGNNVGRAAYDATAYHIRFIRDLVRDFPSFDVSNPLTATTPGYHMLLASIAQVVGDSTTALRLVSLSIGVAFLATVSAWISRRMAPAAALLLSLPLAASIYVVGSAAWTAPDNLAWLMVSVICFLCVREPRGKWDLLLAAAILVPLVAVRQIHIWCAAVIWTAAWSDAWKRGGGVLGATRAALPWFLATLPAAACLGFFVAKWGGLAPPRFQNEVQRLSLATPAFVLLQIAVLSVGFLPWIARPLRRAWDSERAQMLLAATAGLLLALVPETTASFEDGRFGGWWGVVGMLPEFGRTSLAMVVAAPLGAVVVCGLLLGTSLRNRVILGAALAAFVAALTANHYCWQRYHEPFLLVLLPVLAVLQREPKRSIRGLELAAPLALLAMLAVITVLGTRGEPIPEDALPAPGHLAPSDRFEND